MAVYTEIRFFLQDISLLLCFTHDMKLPKSDKSADGIPVLCEMVKAYRVGRGFSIRDMANHTGIEHTALWRFEQGRFLRLRQYANLMRWVFSEPKG